jgi:plasmid maintenance system antidote protein VapI
VRSLRNPNRKPTHPGAILREDVLPEIGWTQTEFASRLMVSRQTVSDLLHEEKQWGGRLKAGFACKSPGSLGCGNEI